MPSKVSNALLSRGFFPKEVPPIFSSRQFGASTSLLRKQKFGDSSAWTSCDSFNMPHSKVGRRIAAVVNPVPFFGLAEAISANWTSIKSLYDKSSLSFSRPVFNGQVRAIGESDFEGFREALITRASGYSYVLHADFSRFFPTIYTHAIEWAVHSKTKAKANLKLPLKRRAVHWGERLDFHVRNMQDGQTQGLPIGPDTSYVVAEIVASAIDDALQKALKKKVKGARLIDDYALFFETRSEAEAALSELTKAAAEFQIALNNDKTYIEEISGPSKESWTYKLQWVDEVKDWRAQRKALLRYTDVAALLFQETKNPSIGRYAVKVMSGLLIHQRNIDLAIACVLRMAHISPGTVSNVARFISGYENIGYKFDAGPVSTFIRSRLSRALDLGFDHEASWCLWMAIELGVKVPQNVSRKVAYSSSSVVVLLAKYAEKKGLCNGVGQGVLGDKLEIDDFRSSNWLLAYEGAMRGWFGWRRADINGSILEPLADNNVYFMDLGVVGPTAIRVRAGQDKERVASMDFDDLDIDELDDLFETEPESDVYGAPEEEGDGDGEKEDDDDDEGESGGERNIFEELGYF